MRELKDVLHYYLPCKVEMTTTAKGRSAFIVPLKRRLKKVEILTPELYDVMIFLRRKPILHPLSSLDYEFFEGSNIDIKYRPEILEVKHKQRTVDSIHFSTLKLCLENHIDIFNLIPEGLAIEKQFIHINN